LGVLFGGRQGDVRRVRSETGRCWAEGLHLCLCLCLCPKLPGRTHRYSEEEAAPGQKSPTPCSVGQPRARARARETVDSVAREAGGVHWDGKERKGKKRRKGGKRVARWFRRKGFRKICLDEWCSAYHHGRIINHQSSSASSSSWF
jgi:hypothetical protein